MNLLAHFPEQSLGASTLKYMATDEPVPYSEFEFLKHLCKGMSLKASPATVIKHNSNWFVSSSSKHNKKLTQMYKGKGPYSAIKGLIAFGEGSLFTNSVTHLFDEETLLSVELETDPKQKPGKRVAQIDTGPQKRARVQAMEACIKN